MIKKTEIEYKITCMHCGEEKEYATSLSADSSSPEEIDDGDFMVCASCGEITVYRDGEWHPTTDEELESPEGIIAKVTKMMIRGQMKIH